MDIAQWAETVLALDVRDFPAERGRTAYGSGGPGYHLAELATSGDFWEDDGTEREETEAQFGFEREALAQRLREHLGQADHFGLHSTFERTAAGEDVDEPWASLSAHVPDLLLWRSPRTGRWVALGVSQWDRELPFQLLAVVTDVDPY
ncbi:hypothetical protein [Streptomyces mangrovisoli]|uniref:Uncharacterized protein n=1 Tax=Streptomyces mangrovisoli TaxID=1428628 RepID=A0A1J4NZJ9_9ACTN|nr:hypothetical protein [Streptomyces mangrovisoli]OIJ66900.1 hypothetical protein WN71_015870 [Streptomyces mangrovisoli]